MDTKLLVTRYQKLRKSQKLTQKQLAAEFGCTPTAISNLERDGSISVDMLLKYAKKFGVSTDYLLGLTDVKSKNCNIREICSSIGLSEQAAEILLAEKAHQGIKKIEAQEKKILQNIQSEGMNQSDQRQEPSEEELELECKRAICQKHIDNMAYFLSALITDKNFFGLCKKFSDGWRASSLHPYMYGDYSSEEYLNEVQLRMGKEDFERYGGVYAFGFDAYADLPEPLQAQLKQETTERANACYYDCLRYFMLFLNEFTPTTKEAKEDAKKTKS